MRDRLAAASDLVLGGVVVAVACVVYLSGVGGRFALNADMIMPYVVHADAIAGPRALSGWLMPESPYWFPDLLLAWAIRSLAPLLVAVNVFAFLQVAAWFALLRWVLGLLAPQSARLAWLIGAFAWLLLVLLTLQVPNAWFDRLAQYLFVPSTHAGALLATLASLGLVLRMQRAPRDLAPLVLLGVLAIAIVLSDRLYAISALLPLLGLAALPILDRRVRARTGLLAFGVLAGSEAWRWASGDADLASRYGAVNTPAGSAAQMAQDFAVLLTSSPAGSAIVLAGLLALCVALVRAWRARGRADEGGVRSARAAAAVFIAASIALPIAASVALGRHTGLDSFRYCQTIGLLLLPLAWQLADAAAGFGRARAAWVVAAAILATTAFAAWRFDTSERALRAEWRGQADCLDRLHAQHGLHGGLSRYWHANSLNAMVGWDAGIVSVSAELESTPINKNIDWLGARAARADEMRVLDFIDEYQFDPARLDQVFGAPRARVACPLSTIRVYDDADGVLGALYRANDWLPQDTLRRHGRAALPASLWAQPPARIEADGLRVEGTFPRGATVLIGAVESTRPLVTLWFDYRLAPAPGASLRWEAVALDAQGRTLDRIAAGTLPATIAPAHHEIALPAPKAGAQGVGVSIVAWGQVDAGVRALGLSTR